VRQDGLVTAPRLVAHRGAPRIARENTLPAIDAAIALGALVVEVDARRTNDGVAVLLHDPTLARLWGDARTVSEVSATEVAALGEGDVRIPTLESAVATARGHGVVLLIDLVSAEDAAVAAATIAALGPDGSAVEWCGHPTAMAAVRDVLPDARVWLAWSDPRPPTAADLEALRPVVLNLDVADLTRDTVDAAHRLGLIVSCWTVDDPATALRAVDLGVDSITTNDLPRLRDVLAGRAG
jgi:glycerophosphoryl diester phosphodiesterase